jgi:hypothetical protein
MKKILIFIISILIGFSACSVPTIVEQGDKNYSVMQWNGGNFYYITYHWKGGKFDDAVDLIRKWITVTKTRNLDEYAIGRFPTGKEWQLGIIASKDLDITEFEGYKIEKMKVPAGTYCSMKAKGYPENIFYYWESFKKQLIKEKYEVISPVYEIYKTSFDQSVPAADRIGEIRYQIKPVK